MAKIGKGALENLTHALYKDARIIYREYIQNSCDQIDIAKKEKSFPNEKLEILININTLKRVVTISDNANGISTREIKKRLEDVADSDKVQGENKGFRGIGRLGGLAYCRELRFITTFKGETTETTMIWNAQKLQEVFSDNTNHSSAEQILDDIISYDTREVNADEHYFKVQMVDIKESAESLLDYMSVKQYISEVAPLGFKKTFIFKSKIDEFISSHDEIPPMHCYNIGIRKNSGELNYLYKDYQTNIYKMQGNHKVVVDTVRDIQTDVIYDSQGQPIAWIWYAVTSLKGAINDLGNPWKGLRLRQFNIQIGEQNALSEFFSENRGNSYFLGEVHTLSKKLRPNARRDYFNETPDVKEFERAIREYFKKLSRLYKIGSELNSSFEKLKKVEQLHKEYNDKLNMGFATVEAQTEKKAELEIAIEKAQEGKKTIQKYQKQAEKDGGEALAKVVDVICNERKIDVENVVIKPVPESSTRKKNKGKNNNNKHQKEEKPKLLVEELTSYDKKTRKVITTIYDIIHKNLPSDDADALIEKIHEELKQS